MTRRVEFFMVLLGTYTLFWNGEEDFLRRKVFSESVAFQDLVSGHLAVQLAERSCALVRIASSSPEVVYPGIAADNQLDYLAGKRFILQI